MNLLNAKSDLLIQVSIDSTRVSFIVPLMITFVGVAIVTVSIGMFEYLIPRSFILLNEYTVNRRAMYLSRRQLFIIGIFAAFIVGTLSSIFASAITDFFINHAPLSK
jgi:hypothetical protein